jgi:hypothetical protein
VASLSEVRTQGEFSEPVSNTALANGSGELPELAEHLVAGLLGGRLVTSWIGACGAMASTPCVVGVC